MHNLSVVNAILTNLSLIIGTYLTFYFAFLYFATKNKGANMSFMSYLVFNRASLSALLPMGLVFGLVSFLLSLNLIPISGEHSGVDTRFILIYFAIIFGSKQLGSLASVNLIFLTLVGHFSGFSETTFDETILALTLTIILFTFACIIKDRQLSLWQAHTAYLAGYFLTKLLIVLLSGKLLVNTQSALTGFFYITIYSFIFLLSAFIIKSAITVSQVMQSYKDAATFDSLTKVYNKDTFDFFLDFVANSSQNSSNTLSLSVLDIDNFKSINDTYGHPIGDLALQHLAKVLTTIDSESIHYVCRIGGDEFAVIHDQSPEDAEAYFEKVFEHLETEAIVLENHAFLLKISVGLTHFVQSPSFNVDTAIKKADSALYQAKKNGKNQLVVTSSQAYKKRFPNFTFKKKLVADRLAS